jgi:cytidine deaminase
VNPLKLTPDDPATIDSLVRAALDVRLRAHAPYSNFQVGAALLADDGEVFIGCNIENASFSLTICAERVAAAAAVTTQNRHWRAIAIASRGGVSPCGACRQFCPSLATTC